MRWILVHKLKEICIGYFCGRNKNISMIGYFDYDLKELAIKNISKNQY